MAKPFHFMNKDFSKILVETSFGMPKSKSKLSKLRAGSEAHMLTLPIFPYYNYPYMIMWTVLYVMFKCYHYILSCLGIYPTKDLDTLLTESGKITSLMWEKNPKKIFLGEFQRRLWDSKRRKGKKRSSILQ